MQQRRAFATFELLIVIALFSLGLGLSTPVLFQGHWSAISPRAGALRYGLMALPALLALLLERRARNEWLRDSAKLFLIAFGFPGALALLLAMGKLLALVTWLL